MNPPSSRQRAERSRRAPLSIVPSPPQVQLEGGRPDELSVKILQPLLGYVLAREGERVVEEVVRSAGVDPVKLKSLSSWITHIEFERVLAAARTRMQSDQEFLEACSFQIEKQYGPIIYVLRTTSPSRVYDVMSRTLHFVSHISRYEMLDNTRTSARMRYTSTRTESRLMCISRQAALRTLPAVWKLPNATLVEESCIGKGDDSCVYSLRWYEVPRALPAVLGLLGGLGLAFLASFVAALRGLEYVTFPLLGASVGLLLETRRSGRMNLEYGDESHRALEALGHEHANAMDELLDLHHRQHEWNQLLELRIAERQAAFDGVVGQVTQLSERRQTTLRSLSHDLRSPLQVIQAGGEYVREMLPPGHEALEVLEEIGHAIGKMKLLFRQLIHLANSDGALFEVHPERVLLAPLAARVRGTLQALVMRRDIRVSVFTTREAPESIETDILLFNRVVDNVLTNAAKYTPKGSIIVEIDGKPDALCLKISDTGKGISEEHLARVFTTTVPDANPLVGDSLGLGLSIVVRLLDQIGGRLEVMSKLEVGSTFWIHFPLRLAEKGPPESGVTPLQETMDQVIRRVVTIRPVSNDV